MTNKKYKHPFMKIKDSYPLMSRFSAIYFVIFISVFVTIGYVMLFKSFAATETNPQTVWAACTNGAAPYSPLSDSAASALVTHQPEVRAFNAKAYIINGVTYPAANYYVPSDAELTNYKNAKNEFNQTTTQATYYGQFVTGRPGLTNPSTDDLIQWGAHKWGIPEDWLRAQYISESYWNHFQLGDQSTESAAWYPQFPVQSRVSGSSTDVFESMGISQVKWRPDNSVGIGTEPLRWKSTAFNIDFQAAQIRFYYDNPNGLRTTWGDASYVPCQQWNSLGGWFEPYPWNNIGQLNYISSVQSHLNNRDWTTSSFINATFTFPSAISFTTNPPPPLPPPQPPNPNPSPGDINGDSSINITDLSLLLSSYGQTTTQCITNATYKCDLSSPPDGNVNIFDLSILLSHYGT
jgi:hypothetical protein